MSVTGILITNILPLYVLIALGYIGGRWMDINIHSLARVAIFIISPIVTFGAMAKLTPDMRYLALPLCILVASVGIALVVYRLAQRCWGNNTANLIGIGCVGGNTGYFGIPLVLALYGQSVIGVYLLMNVAFGISEVTLGYYIAARGHSTMRESLIKVAKLPTLHALYLGLIVNALHITLPDVFYTYWTYALGVWVYLGMMIIGVALAKLPRLEFDWRLARWLFTAKFLLWPVAGLGIMFADMYWWHFFTPEVRGAVLIITSVPLAANVVAYAAQLNLHAERAASCVLLSTFFALLSMPAMFMLARYFQLVP